MKIEDARIGDYVNVEMMGVVVGVEKNWVGNMDILKVDVGSGRTEIVHCPVRSCELMEKEIAL